MARLSPDGPVIHDGCTITDSTFGAYTEVGAMSRIAGSHFGAYSYCDRLADIANARIGRFANIASGVRIGATDHPLDTAACHHFLYRSGDYWDDAEADAGFFAHRASRRAVIGHDTWLGHNAQVKPEVVVGDGAVVAAGAVVTRDVAPYTIVAGIPARKLRNRQPPEIARRLITLAWWDWTHAALREALDDFRRLDVEAFLDRHGG